VDVALSQWTITAYLVTMTALLLFFGRVSDFTGKAVLFTAGQALFTLGSLACGLSATLAQLVIFRGIQAVGGAMVFSISGAILFLSFPPEERGRAMGYLGSTVAAGSILGPILGGFLVDSLGWRYIFLINLPIGIVLVACALLFLRTGEARSPEFHMDWPGAGTLVVSLVSLMLFFSTIGGFSDSPLLPLVSGALFLVFTALFVLRESSCDRPLLDLRIFRVRGFLLPVVAMMLFFIATYMMNIAGPFYFQGVMGFRPTQVGLVFLVVPVVMVAASPVTGLLYDKRRWRHYGTIGVSIVSFSFIVLALLARRYSLAGMSACFFFLGLGSALFQSPNNTEIMNSLPRSQTAIASSVSSAGRNLAMTLGTAFASTLLPFLLRLAGHRGTVMEAERGLLAGSVATVMLVSGVVCLLAAVALLFNKPTTGTSETN
jgi:EmrB/QacA subfamily drug resistance transporter